MKKKKIYPAVVAFRLEDGDRAKLERVTAKLTVSKSEFLRRYLMSNVLNFEV